MGNRIGQILLLQVSIGHRQVPVLPRVHKYKVDLQAFLHLSFPDSAADRFESLRFNPQ